MELVLECITKKYADFSARAQRTEFWLFILAYTIVYIIAIVIDVFLGLYDYNTGLGLVSGIYLLATLVPYLAAIVRRLHDTDRSGWWILIGLVPLVGTVWLIVLMCLKGTDGQNRFGSDPLSA